MGIASLVLGIVALVTAFIPCVGIYAAGPLGLIGLILGIVSRGKAAKEEGGSTGLPTAGLILSVVALVVAIWWWNKQRVALEELGAGLEDLKADLQKAGDKLDADLKKAAADAAKAPAEAPAEAPAAPAAPAKAP